MLALAVESLPQLMITRKGNDILMSEKDAFYFQVTRRYAGLIDTDLMTAICYAINLTTENFVSGAYQHCIYDLDIHSMPNHGVVANTVQVYTDEAKLAAKYERNRRIDRTGWDFL